MSSREIAELTGKEHKNVIRDIRVMLAELGDGSHLSHVHEARDGRGYTADIRLPKDLTITLVSGYSVPMRHRIVTRWLELEAQPRADAPAIPQTFAQALLLAAQQAQQLEEQAFRKWITSVVLPAIRKDGAYVMGEEKVATGEMSEAALDSDNPPH